jgi:hypothetical protein
MVFHGCKKINLVIFDPVASSAIPKISKKKS